MALPVKTFTEVVDQQASAMQAVSTNVLDFNIGSVNRALIEANAGNFLWLQALAVKLLSITRLATSEGNEVDSFIQDFGFSRNTGSPASGNVTFSRLSPTVAASVPVGSIVSVGSINGLSFIVTVDVDNPAYNPTTNSYDLAISVPSVSVPAQCTVVGTIGNVLAGEINTVNSPIVGIDFVTNAADFTNGVNVWDDAQTRAEFVLYLQSLFRATYAAIKYAVESVNGVERDNEVENIDYTTGDPHYGYFYAVIDDGSGDPPDSLVDAVAASVELYRGFTIAYEVRKPETLTANIAANLTLISSPTRTDAEIIQNVENALRAYIDGLGFGALLPYTRLPEIIYDADNNILNVTGITLNSGSSDLQATGKEIILVGTLTILIP